MSAVKSKATPPAKADATMADDNKKRKVKEDDAECNIEEFNDCNNEPSAQEDSPTESATGSVAVTSAGASTASSLPPSASNSGATLDTIVAMLGKIGSDVASVTVLVADNTNKIAATTAKVDKVNAKVDQMDNNFNLVAAKVENIEKEMKAAAKAAAVTKRNVPTFAMSPRADPRGVDPLIANDAWANNRAAGLGYTPPQTAAAAAATPYEEAWKDWHSEGRTAASASESPHTLAAKAADRNAHLRRVQA